MAAGRNIKGITIEIGGDTTGLQKALSGVNDKLKNTQAQLKDVNTLLKYGAGSAKTGITEKCDRRHSKQIGHAGGGTERCDSSSGGRKDWPGGVHGFPARS